MGGEWLTGTNTKTYLIFQLLQHNKGAYGAF